MLPNDRCRSCSRVLAALPLVVALALAAVARAEEIPEYFTPVRAAGMGGAFTAVANDESALWTNPAGVARARKARSRQAVSVAKFPNLILGANTESRDFYKSISGSQQKSVEGAVENLGGATDKPFWARAAVFPVALFDAARDVPMAFSVYSNTTAKAVVAKDSPDVARIDVVSDVGSVLNFGLTNDANRFGASLQLRPIARYAYEDRIPSSELVDKTALRARLKDGANRSQGLGVDFGMLYTVADFWFPTIGLSVLNLPTGCHDNYLNPFDEKRERVCGTVYHGSFGNEDALSTVDPTDLRLGVAITPRLGRKLNMRFALDAHNLPVGSASQSYGLQGIEASKLLHAGVELFPGNPLQVADYAVRAGYGQGFVSVGASAALGPIVLEFATYGQDVSSTKSPIEDRRILTSLTAEF